MELVGRYGIVEIGVELWTDDDQLCRQFRAFLAPFADEAVRSPTRYEVRKSAWRDRTYVVTQGDRPILYPNSRDLAVRALLWHWNTRVMQETTCAVAVHAGAVCRDSQAIILPGHSGAGKSTLVAALVVEGLEYLSDEGALIDLQNHSLVPYPRPLSLDTTSMRVLGIEPDDARWSTHERLVLADALRPGSLAIRRPTVHLIAFVSRGLGGRTSIGRISRAAAARMLADRTPNLGVVGERGFDALVGAVAKAVVVEVQVGDPRAAARLLRLVLDGRGPAEMSFLR